MHPKERHESQPPSARTTPVSSVSNQFVKASSEIIHSQGKCDVLILVREMGYLPEQGQDKEH